MADKIVIMKDGIIQQIGDPYSVYFEPRNKFVAGHRYRHELISAKLVSEGGKTGVVKRYAFRADRQGGDLEGSGRQEHNLRHQARDIYDKMYAVAPKEEFTVKGVDVVEPLGSETLIHDICGDDIVQGRSQEQGRGRTGDRSRIRHDHAPRFDPETEENVLAGTHENAQPKCKGVSL